MISYVIRSAVYGRQEFCVREGLLWHKFGHDEWVPARDARERHLVCSEAYMHLAREAENYWARWMRRAKRRGHVRVKAEIRRRRREQATCRPPA